MPLQRLDYLPFPVAGVDEAGRGCLAGPVVAAAVILPQKFHIPELNDSKQISAKTREGLEKEIKSESLSWSLGVIWPREIERLNILQATMQAMHKAVSHLRLWPGFVLIDGIHAPRFNIPSRCIKKGDSKIVEIAAASILAKTFRDKLMCSLDKRYPGYFFAQHKGYATKMHLECIKRQGPSSMHRMTFKPLAGAGSFREEQGWLPGI